MTQQVFQALGVRCDFLFLGHVEYIALAFIVS